MKNACFGGGAEAAVSRSLRCELSMRTNKHIFCFTICHHRHIYIFVLKFNNREKDSIPLSSRKDDALTLCLNMKDRQ